MKKLSFFIMAVTLSATASAKEINVNTLINTDALNCKIPSRMMNFVYDFHSLGNKAAQLNKNKQSMQLDQNTYLGIQGYQQYQTKAVVQNDFAVNFNVYGVKVMKMVLKGTATKGKESWAYYYVFEGKPGQVSQKLHQAMGDAWTYDLPLQETPQGNSKLLCDFPG